jgi:magnesium-transporting ATPase (P-type)
MCTGDNIDTATAISLEAGIISLEDLAQNEENLLCMQGSSFRQMVGGLKSEKLDNGSNKDFVGDMSLFRKVA